jgi:hypothetical protein
MAEIDRAQLSVPPPTRFARTAASERDRHQMAGMPPETQPPVFGAFSPVAGAVSRAAAVGFTVTDPDGFSSIFVWAVLADGSTVVVYDGSAFGPEVNAASTVGGTTTKSFSITYDGAGWPDDYTLHARAVDAMGASATTSAAYTITDPPAAPEAPDTTAPTVTLVSPADGSRIGRYRELVIDVTDTQPFTAILWITYPGSTPDDLVYVGGWGFAKRYAVNSTVATIGGGYRYTLRREGGWPAHPTVYVKPFDASGNTP